MKETQKVIDLTHWMDNQISAYPGDPVPSVQQISSIQTSGYQLSQLVINSHLATHIDAPSHVLSEGKSLEDFPLSKFIGSGLCIDCSKKEHIELDDVAINTNSPPQFILLHTGHAKKWGHQDYYIDYPCLTYGACLFLIQLGLKGIGIDCPNFDPKDSQLKIHRQLLTHEILLIENLCNLDLLVGTWFDLFCAPLKYHKADGSPVRAFAVITKK